MQVYPRKRVTIITEASLEAILKKELHARGVRGFTISDVRGQGDRGERNAAWDAAKNIQIELICDEKKAQSVAEGLWQKYQEDYALIIYISSVEVFRPEKF